MNQSPLYFLLGGKEFNSIRVFFFFDCVSSSCDLNFPLAQTIASLTSEFLSGLTFKDLDSSIWFSLELVDIVRTIKVDGKSAWLRSISDINDVLKRYYIFHIDFSGLNHNIQTVTLSLIRFDFCLIIIFKWSIDYVTYYKLYLLHVFF